MADGPAGDGKSDDDVHAVEQLYSIVGRENGWSGLVRDLDDFPCQRPTALVALLAAAPSLALVGVDSPDVAHPVVPDAVVLLPRLR